MQPQQLEALIITAIDDLKANDIVSINVSKLTSITDYMIICSGTSTRHVKSIASNAREKAKEHKVKVLGSEGEQHGEWVLVDFGDVVLHVMLPATRDFYHLEKLWSSEHEAGGAVANQ